MLGTIVWDQYASGTYGKLRPHYKEYNDIDDIIDNLTYLQICCITLILSL